MINYKINRQKKIYIFLEKLALIFVLFNDSPSHVITKLSTIRFMQV